MGSRVSSYWLFPIFVQLFKETPYEGFENFGLSPHNKVSSDQALMLAAPISDLEIYKVLNSMKWNKSLGLDGFNVNFFINCWDIVGHFTQVIKYFFSSGRLTKGINSTTLALIPKFSNPNSMADFRPISCCNTFYKCIAKILSNRLKDVLPLLLIKHSLLLLGAET